MRSFLIIGGLIGFLVGILTGMAQESSWATILWRSSVAALVGGLVFRWWGTIWMKSLVEAQYQRQDAIVNQPSTKANQPVADQARE